MAYGILLDYLMGQSIDAFRYFGAHFGYIEVEKEEVVPPKTKGGKARKVKVQDKLYGVWFRLYAPLASDVSVIGEFNGWDVRSKVWVGCDNTSLRSCCGLIAYRIPTHSVYFTALPVASYILPSRMMYNSLLISTLRTPFASVAPFSMSVVVS